jgi:hypothetical protein
MITNEHNPGSAPPAKLFVDSVARNDTRAAHEVQSLRLPEIAVSRERERERVWSLLLGSDRAQEASELVPVSIEKLLDFDRSHGQVLA